MKRFITIILIIMLAVTSAFITTGASRNYLIECQGEVFSFENMFGLSERAEMEKERQRLAHELANKARELGFPEDHPTIVAAKEIWNASEVKKEDYQNAFEHMKTQLAILEEEERKQAAEEARWEEKAAQYPNATYIWRYLKNLGYNDYVCAGIMGNLMTEVGGQTLNIQYWLYGNGFYGMCQWNKAYPSIWGKDLAEQCNFLRDTIEYEFNTYGRNYQSGFNYQSFLSLTNSRSAALAFAKVYERCGSSTYGIRQNNAEKAYNYFVN